MPKELQVFFSTFVVIFLAELGDKTQLAVISLTAKEKMPLIIFLGSALALAVASGLGVVGGEVLLRLVPANILHKIAAVGFALMGILIWFEIL